MTKQEFQKLTEDHVLLLDGATGSNLMKAGMPRGVCTESWVLEHKDVIQSLQKAYIEAGSHIIYAPTFGGNRINLTMHGLEDQIEQILSLIHIYRLREFPEDEVSFPHMQSENSGIQLCWCRINPQLLFPVLLFSVLL